jgi:hypothetical protein
MKVQELIERASRALKFIRTRKIDYQLCFTSPAGRAVLYDLAKFCRANESCLHPDPVVHAALGGRREVWLRIQQHLALTPTQLLEIFSASQVRAIEGDEDA